MRFLLLFACFLGTNVLCIEQDSFAEIEGDGTPFTVPTLRAPSVSQRRLDLRNNQKIESFANENGRLLVFQAPNVQIWRRRTMEQGGGYEYIGARSLSARDAALSLAKPGEVVLAPFDANASASDIFQVLTHRDAPGMRGPQSPLANYFYKYTGRQTPGEPQAGLNPACCRCILCDTLSVKYEKKAFLILMDNDEAQEPVSESDYKKLVHHACHKACHDKCADDGTKKYCAGAPAPLTSKQCEGLFPRDIQSNDKQCVDLPDASILPPPPG